MTIFGPGGEIIRGANGKGKKPRLPTLQELAVLRPLPLLTPTQFAEISQQPTPLSEAGATSVEWIYFLYRRLSELENMLASPDIPGTV